MSLDKADIEKLAELARVRVVDEDLPEVTERIASILELVDQMQAVDTSGVEPLANPLDARQRLRPDRVTEGDRRGEFQALAKMRAEESASADEHRLRGRRSGRRRRLRICELGRWAGDSGRAQSRSARAGTAGTLRSLRLFPRGGWPALPGANDLSVCRAQAVETCLRAADFDIGAG